jgi:hypothetical protein
MARRHDRTLAEIFAAPTRGTITWREVESLLRSLGADVEESAGSRVAIVLNERVAVMRRPHPHPTMSKGAVRDLRDFLRSAGVHQKET